MTVTELSTESQQMLDIVDQYERGDLNMDEAIVKISDLAPIGDNRIEELLLGVERENVLKFPEPRFEEVEEPEEEDEACSKYIFSFSADFDLDDPA